MTDAVAAAQRGSGDALHLLYVRYAAEVRGSVRSVAKDEQEAEDITRAVFLELVTSIRRYEPREAPFLSWLTRVARNAAFDHLRARRAMPVEEDRVGDGQPAGAAPSVRVDLAS